MKLGIKLIDGDWEIILGSVQLANYLLAKIYIIFQVQKGTWIYDKNLGSDIPQLIKQRQNIKASQLIQILNSALNPLIINNEITNINIVCTFEKLGIFKFDIHCIDITQNYFLFQYTIRL